MVKKHLSRVSKSFNAVSRVKVNEYTTNKILSYDTAEIAIMEDIIKSQYNERLKKLFNFNQSRSKRKEATENYGKGSGCAGSGGRRG